MNVLITGSNGQLGSEVRKLSSEHPHWSFIFTDIKELDLTKSEDIHDFFEKNKTQGKRSIS